MKWIKKGLIHAPSRREPWGVSHAQLPVVDVLDHQRWRIYFGTRDEENRTVTTFIEVSAEDPTQVLKVHDRPVMGLGERGCFDDSGVMPSWIVDHAGRKLLYYIGWNRGVSVPYRNAVGLAVSDDGGETFRRVGKGPIVGRSCTEPHFCGASCVLLDGAIWRMWYLSCIRWIVCDGKPEPIYDIKYAESQDGIEWHVPGTVAVALNGPDEGGLTRPSVIKDGSLYRMWYSRRKARDYRTNPANSYRIGYAESHDGITFERKDDLAGIDVSESGWDSEMITYAHVFDHGGRRHMIYNGNGFGRTGIGYAVLGGC